MALSAAQCLPWTSSCRVRHGRSALLAAIACATGSAFVQAQQAEFCVSCSGPEAQYRCTFDGAAAGKSGLQLYCISTLAKDGKHESCSINRAAKTPCTGALKVLALPDGLPDAPPPKSAGPSAEPPPTANTATTRSQTVPSSQGGPPSADVEAQASDTGTRAAKPVWSGNSGRPAATPANPPPSPPASTSAPEDPDPAPAEQASPALTKPLEDAGKAVGEAAKTTGSALEKAGSAVGSAAKKSWKCLTSLFGDC